MKIIELMKQNNITQSGLAAEIGVTQSTLSRNINGIHEPKADVIQKIADFFGVSTDYLLGNSKTHNVRVLDENGVTDLQIELLNETNGFTTKDMERVLEYVDFIKAKKSSKEN